MDKQGNPPQNLFNLPFPTHPFWGRKAHLPGAKLLRIVKRERERGFYAPTKLILEDNSVWEVFFEDAAKPLRWPFDTACVLVREGERRVPSSSYTTYLEELNSGDMVVARRLS